MTAEVHVPGVRLVRRPPFDVDATYPPETFFAFNFAKITRGTLLGPQAELIVDGKPWVEPWPWRWVAGWILGKTTHGQPHEPAEEQDRWVERVRGWFRAEPDNEPFLDLLNEFEIPTHVPDWHLLGNIDLELILFLKEDLEGLREFKRWYARRLEQVETETAETQTKQLRSTIGAAIRKAKAEHETLQEEVIEPLTRALPKLQLGDLTFQVMFDFAKPREERIRMWGKEGGADFVDPEPNASRRSLAKIFRKDWREQLLQPCADLISGLGPREIDADGWAVLRMLRDENGAVLSMFRRWDTLCPAAQADLVQTTEDAVRLVLMGETSRASMIESEFMSIAAAVNEVSAAVGPEGDDAYSQRLRAAIDSLKIAAPAPTPFGSFIADKFSSARDMCSHGAVALDLLVLATPHIARQLKTHNLYGVFDTAWLWRAAVSTARLTKNDQKTFWRNLAGLVEDKRLPDKKPRRPIRLLDLERGSFSYALAESAAVWKTLAVLVDCLTVATAAQQQREETPARALSELAAITGLMKSSFELVTAQADFARLLDHTSEAELEALAREFGGSKAVPIVGLVADGLALAVSVRRAYDAKKSWSKETQERAVRNAYLDGLSLATTAVGLALGAELVIIAMLIYGTQMLLEDPDAWMPYLPFTDIARKPGPHRYLESLLKELDDDDTLKEALNRPATRELAKSLASLLNYYELAIVKDSERVLWDFGGAPGRHLDWPAKRILEWYYRFPSKVSQTLARASMEAKG